MGSNKIKVIGFLVMIISFNNYAQNKQLGGCSATLIELEEYYKTGRFERVNTILKNCMDKYKNEDTDYELALRIQAKNAIAMDSMDLATTIARELLNFKPNYTRNAGDPYLLVELIKSLKIKGATVSSVSKFEEALGEAPATVILITEDEIIDRGYNDLEALLHDLPGFDITRSVGLTYSHIYQRGYRSDNTNRMLFVVDGIEQNDLWGNIVYLSRQYPITNIKSVEVVYGPASTIYGANAYLGVVSIITKNANDFFVGDHKNHTVATDAMLTYGDYNSMSADVTTVFKSKKSPFSTTFTARYFSSDEFDLSEFEEYDYAQVADNSISYSNRSESIFLGSKIESQNFTMGFGYWHKKEGVGGWTNDQVYINNTDLTSWNPYNAFIYAKYDKALGSKEKLYFSNFTRYKISGLDDATTLSVLPLTPVTIYFDLHSNQLRNETQLVYKANNRFSLISGLEFRFSEIQADYGKTQDVSYLKYVSYDAGLYSQAAYQVVKDKLKFTIGGRLDYNETRNSDAGYGVVFNPRLALVYSPKNTFVKLIYSEAFMNPTNFQRYSLTSQRQLPNPNLLTEKVKNYEFSFRRDFMKSKLFAEIVLYNSFYSNVVNEVGGNEIFIEDDDGNLVSTLTNQFQNTGERNVYGAQANINYNDQKLRLFLNYTYTNPTDTDLLSGQELRIADISSHQFNFGGNYKFNNGLNINLRTNFIGEREVGPGTTVADNIHDFDSYFLLNATIGYGFFKKKCTLQFSMNNILDHQYYSPGIRSASAEYSSRIPQFGRNMQLRLSFKL